MRNAATVHISAGIIERLLDLPPNVHVRHVTGSCDPVGVKVVLEGPDLPEVSDNAEAPVIFPAVFITDLGQVRFDLGLKATS